MTFLSKETAALTGERWFGLDLAKRETQLAALDSTGKQIQQKRFATTREQFLAMASELRTTDTVALEVTTNSTAIGRLIRDNSKAKVIVSNPIKTKIIAQAKIKTDKIDARVLAELARVGYLPEVWLPDEDTESLRQFITDRTSLVRRRTECKNTVHSVLHRNLVSSSKTDLFGTAGRQWLEAIVHGEDASVDTPIPQLDRLRIGSLINEIDRIDAMVADLESVVASYIAVRPSLKQHLDRLMSIPGVSLVTGAGIMAAVGDVTRFAHKKKLAAYFGVVPSTKQSGDTSRNGRITKQGRAEARWLLIESAEVLRKSPGPMRALYNRIAKKKNHNVAVVAVARKLIELVHHLLLRKEDYIYRLPRLTQEKRARWRFLARQKLGIRVKSAAAKASGRTALYGTGIEGRRLKSQIAKQAAANAERLYQAIVEQREEKLKDPNKTLVPASTLVFDPTRPNETDWERILSQAAEKLIKKKTTPTKTATA